MADVKPYVMMDNIMSKSVAIDFFLPQFWQIVLIFCGILWPTYVMADIAAICYG